MDEKIKLLIESADFRITIEAPAKALHMSKMLGGGEAVQDAQVSHEDKAASSPEPLPPSTPHGVSSSTASAPAAEEKKSKKTVKKGKHHCPGCNKLLPRGGRGREIYKGELWHSKCISKKGKPEVAVEIQEKKPDDPDQPMTLELRFKNYRTNYKGAPMCQECLEDIKEKEVKSDEVVYTQNCWYHKECIKPSDE